MRIFALRARAFIENAVKDFGTAEQQAVWTEWSSDHPQVRHSADDPEDDGSGPMPDTIRSLILDTLHKRFSYLMAQIRSPLIGPNEAASLSGDVGTVYAIALSISPTLVWSYRWIDPMIGWVQFDDRMVQKALDDTPSYPICVRQRTR